MTSVLLRLLVIAIIAGAIYLGVRRIWRDWTRQFRAEDKAIHDRDLKERDGKKVIVFHLRNQEDVEATYKLEGDTLTLDGGTIEPGGRGPGGRGDRPAFFKFELKGEWKRVNVDLENKFRRAFPGLEVEALAIKIDLRSQRLVIGATNAVMQDGRLRLTDCVLARVPDVPPVSEDEK